MAPARLKTGDRVRLPNGQTAVVEYVNPCRAHIRLEARRNVQIDGPKGHVAFTAPGRTVDISPNSDLEIIGRLSREEIEEMSAKKKAAKKATPNKATPKKANAPKEELCTFAIRITLPERDAIHKAGGPRGATAWARKTLAEAAAKATAKA